MGFGITMTRNEPFNSCVSVFAKKSNLGIENGIFSTFFCIFIVTYEYFHNHDLFMLRYLLLYNENDNVWNFSSHRLWNRRQQTWNRKKW